MIMFSEKQRSEILGLLREKKAGRVLVQVPEGLKKGSIELLDYLEGENIDCVLSAEPCFGACDLRDKEAKVLGCNLVLHIGHMDFGLETSVPVVYYEYKIEHDLVPLAKAAMNNIRHRKLCLVSTVQFSGSLGTVKKFLEKNGFEVHIGGEILGCDTSRAEKYENIVEAFLFIGSGRFHPLGLQERVSKPVLFLDVEKRALEDLHGEKAAIEVKREMRLQKARDLSRFGIIVSTKPGQMRIKTAEKLKKYLREKGKSAFILCVDQLTPDKILGVDIEAIVNTACPRMSEDSGQFKKLMLGPEDAFSL